MLPARRITVFFPALRRAVPYAYIPFIAFGIVSTAVAIAQAFGWHPVPEWIPEHPSGLLFNAVVQGAFLALGIITLVTYRVFWPILLLAPGLYLTDSRGSFGAVAFGLLAQYFRRPLWLLAIVLAIAVYISHNPNSSDLQRVRIWYAAATHLTFWGHGYGSFWYLWIGNPAWWPQYAHNDFLQAVFELGVWALIPFSFLGWAASRTRTHDWPILATFLFIGFFSMPLHMPEVAAFGALALVSTLGDINA